MKKLEHTFLESTMSVPMFLGLFMLLCFPQLTLATCTKTMRWSDDAPFTYADPLVPGRIVGVSADLARIVLSEMGCELKLAEMPWARALLELEAGRVDIVSSAYIKPERQVYAHYSKVGIYFSPNVIFVRAEDAPTFNWSTLSELVGKKFILGVQINVSYGAEYDALKSDPVFSQQLRLLSDRQSLWQMLKLKRVDGVIADEFTGKLELKELGLAGQILPVSLVFPAEHSFFIFSKKTTDPKFVKEFDEHLQQLKNNGQYEAIINKYLQ